MAATNLIPGYGYITPKGTGTNLVPGYGYVKENATVTPPSTNPGPRISLIQ
jgi:hypothetical protein